MDVPDSQSIWGVLLYWDKLGSMVPEGVVRGLSSWTRSLVDADLVEPIEPRRYLQDVGFVEGFAELLDRLPSEARPTAPVLVHVDKGQEGLWDLLSDRGLAERGRRTARYEWGRKWIAVEGRAGALYLAYLAATIARSPDLDLEPITDQRRYFEAVSGSSVLATAHSLDQVRAGILRGVLPVPVGDVRPEDVATFKEKHHSLLLALRHQVERAVLESSRCGGLSSAQSM
jgi:hypothetical protein